MRTFVLTLLLLPVSVSTDMVAQNVALSAKEGVVCTKCPMTYHKFRGTRNSVATGRASMSNKRPTLSGSSSLGADAITMRHGKT